MWKIFVDNLSDNWKINIPVDISNVNENKYKIIAICILIFITIIWISSLFWSPTIEDYRINNLNKSKRIYKNNLLLKRDLIKEIEVVNFKIQSSQDCIIQNSNVWVATECSLLFNK